MTLQNSLSHSHPDPRYFKAESAKALADTQLRQNFRGAMDFLIDRRVTAFADLQDQESLRSLATEIRQHALSRLPELLIKLESRLTELGVQVHWAETADDANRIFLQIAEQHQARLMVKGKSMVSEEIELNAEMARHGIDCIETDMGEFILQIDGDRPSHIIMPAIHKTREQVSQLFADKIPGAGYIEDVNELIATGRRFLRDRFQQADIGVSGANFLVADSGSIVLVENEGNGRLCTTVPKVHIAITGIEKVVESMEQVWPLYALLPRSATGQSATTYLNILTGPRRPGELDGPQHMHLILLDNGRSQAYANPAYRKTLQCIRCGACMNHCPVYTRIGGHSYGTTYPGPIGAIISPHLLGLEQTQDLPTASSLCGACGEVCPVGIPIPELLTDLRAAARHREARPAVEAQQSSVDQRPALAAQGSVGGKSERLVWALWRLIHAQPWLYALYLGLATRFRALTPRRQPGWSDSRLPLVPAAQSMRSMLKASRRRTG